MKRTWCLCALFALLSSPVFATKITRGPYFQLMRPHSVYVRYTTDNACDTVVTFRKTFGTEQVTASDNTLVTDHQVKITGFSTFIEYLYTIGTSTEKLMSGNGSWLWTSPDDDHPGVKMQFWVLGNSGDGKKGSKKVRNAFQSYMNTNNLINGMTLFLGNNTKQASEKSYKKKLFKVFKDQFLHAPFFTTLGENDTDGSTDPPPDLPYFTLFNLPTGTEGGGVASGTPKYYSFDYGIAHIVVLDSQSSDRSKNGSMMTWLKNDLEANIEPWLIAMFHHAVGDLGGRSRLPDLLATACLLTAAAIGRSGRRFVPDFPDDIFVSGGGTRNRVMMSFLKQQLGEARIRVTDELGVPSVAKEAIAFALLGAATLDGEPSNVPSVTGARHAVVLGSITPQPKKR